MGPCRDTCPVCEGTTSAHCPTSPTCRWWSCLHCHAFGDAVRVARRVGA